MSPNQNADHPQVKQLSDCPFKLGAKGCSFGWVAADPAVERSSVSSALPIRKEKQNTMSKRANLF
jgi:hypothetical protein